MARRFIWDESKRRTNLRKHGIDFQDLPGPFDGPSIDNPDVHHSDVEERWQRLIWFHTRVVLVVYTERGDTIRVISARPATAEETDIYLDHHFSRFAD
jgi:hypothetical protein